MAGAAWAALIPFARTRAGLDDAGLGLLLLGLAGGSIVAMPTAGAVAGRLGCRLVVGCGLGVACAALPLLAVLPSFWLLLPALLLFGAGFGSLDVAMNMQAILVERSSGRAIMSGFHGMFSLGGITGAAGMAAGLGLGLAPLPAVLVTVSVLLAGLGAAWGGLLPDGAARDGPAFGWPRGVVLVLGLLCFVAFLAEGAVFDWGGVLLTLHRGVPAVYGGVGYAAFSATMTLGRFTGDRVVGRFGPGAVMVGSGLLSAAGFAVVAAVPSWVAALAGFALVGAGCANIAPVLFTAVGRQQAMPESLALPAVTTLGYAGMLAGPAGIGFVAHAAGLPWAFLVVAGLLLGVAAAGRRVTRG